MTHNLDIVAVVGSLRQQSFTRRLVRALAALAAPSLQIEIAEIGDLPLYNEDLEHSAPASWSTFRTRVRRADGILFATPEYNRSVPGCLKNAIDVGSRPYGKSVWAGKPAAILSASPGAIGAFGANHHLRQSLVFLDMPTLQQPEAYIGRADKLTDADGNFVEASSQAFFAGFIGKFEAWIRQQRLTQPSA